MEMTSLQPPQKSQLTRGGLAFRAQTTQTEPRNAAMSKEHHTIQAYATSEKSLVITVLQMTMQAIQTQANVSQMSMVQTKFQSADGLLLVIATIAISMVREQKCS